METLPKLAPPPASFKEIMDTGIYNVFGTTTAERAAGCTLS